VDKNFPFFCWSQTPSPPPLPPKLFFSRLLLLLTSLNVALAGHHVIRGRMVVASPLSRSADFFFPYLDRSIFTQSSLQPDAFFVSTFCTSAPTRQRSSCRSRRPALSPLLFFFPLTQEGSLFCPGMSFFPCFPAVTICFGQSRDMAATSSTRGPASVPLWQQALCFRPTTLSLQISCGTRCYFCPGRDRR